MWTVRIVDAEAGVNRQVKLSRVPVVGEEVVVPDPETSPWRRVLVVQNVRHYPADWGGIAACCWGTTKEIA